MQLFLVSLQVIRIRTTCSKELVVWCCFGYSSEAKKSLQKCYLYELYPLKTSEIMLISFHHVTFHDIQRSVMGLIQTRLSITCNRYKSYYKDLSKAFVPSMSLYITVRRCWQQAHSPTLHFPYVSQSFFFVYLTRIVHILGLFNQAITASNTAGCRRMSWRMQGFLHGKATVLV